MAQERKHDGLEGAADRAKDMVGGMMGRAKAGTVGATDSGAFVENAAIGGLYEIAAAEIALERSDWDDVRMVARKMINDHRTASHQLTSTLRSLPNAPEAPEAPDSRRAEMLDHLRAAPDADFDGRYLEQQEMAHKETITLFEGYAETGDDPRLRQYVQATLPSLHRHLQMVRALR